MLNHANQGKSSLFKSIDNVLGYDLSPRTKKFASEHADFLLRVDFKDITEHSVPEIRIAEGHYTFDGAQHTIWLSRKSPDFEGLFMHETMRGILLERGFPRAYPFPATSCSFVCYLSFLLSSAVIDPVIDSRLVTSGFEVYNRQILINRAMSELWHDVHRDVPKDGGFLFIKWVLFTVFLRLDPAFEKNIVAPFRRLIRKEFPLSAEFGDRLSASISETGFADPFSALTAMVRMRNALKLHNQIAVVDRGGTYW